MCLTSIKLKNFTVFEEETIEFSDGINVIVGPNGVGKTHLLKLLYAAAQAVDPKVSLPQKVVRCFMPDDYSIARLYKKQQSGEDASVKFTANKRGSSDTKNLTLIFNSKTSKWDADVTGKKGWEEQLSGMSGVMIPAKEILSNAYNLNAAVEKNNVSFDDTYIDVINSAKVDVSVGDTSKEKEKRLATIEKIIMGKVAYDVKKDEFYLKRGNSKLEFPLVAEGIRKASLIWQLVKNGSLEKGAILMWDEPEANLNPAYIPIIAEVLLELERSGVQVFVSTHDYFLSKYIETRRKDNHVRFLSLHQTEKGVKCEFAEKFVELKNNSIMDTFISLYEEEIGKAID